MNFIGARRSEITDMPAGLRDGDLLLANALDAGAHQLFDDAIDEEWVGQLDKLWVLLGTLDQLLWRALHRSSSMSRCEWPVHFGLLNEHCRWLLDKAQVMGVGLRATSQLDCMRRKLFPSLKSCFTNHWDIGSGMLGHAERQDILQRGSLHGL